MLVLLIIFGVWYFFYYKSHKNNIPTSLQEYLDNSSAIINTKIRDMDISSIQDIVLIPNNSGEIRVKSKNLMKLTKLIVDETHKTEFPADEISRIYEYILSNYKTELDLVAFNKTKEELQPFIKNGGKIVILYKENSSNPILVNGEVSPGYSLWDTSRLVIFMPMASFYVTWMTLAHTFALLGDRFFSGIGCFWIIPIIPLSLIPAFFIIKMVRKIMKKTHNNFFIGTLLGIIVGFGTILMFLIEYH